MPLCRIQHAYNHKSGLPRDAVVNTFHFDSGTSGGAALTEDVADDLAQLVIQFYDAVSPGVDNPIRFWIAEATMAPLRHTVKAYNMSQPKPRAPIYQQTTAGSAANNTTAAAPGEVALCLSYRGSIVSGIAPARRRGRVYIGPLRAESWLPDANGNARPDPVLQNVLAESGRELAESSAALNFPWVVHSETQVVVAGMHPVIQHTWVDNAFDTQRRRGVSPTSRVVRNFSY